MKKVNLVAICLLAAVFVAGCAKPLPLTEEGKKVRVISQEEAKQCKFLGILISSKNPNQGGHESAMNDAINRAAKAGGDAVVDISDHGNAETYRTSGLASVRVYKCGK